MTTIVLAVLTSRNFHSNLLRSILRSSMNFFESVPIGILINRFSKDINSLETILPVSINEVVFCLIEAITTIIVIAIATPLSLTFLIPICIVYFFLQVYKNLIYNKNKKFFKSNFENLHSKTIIYENGCQCEIRINLRSNTNV